MVDETCDPYLALDRDANKTDSCVDFNICRNCNHTACWAVPEPQRYYVDEYVPLCLCVCLSVFTHT